MIELLALGATVLLATAMAAIAIRSGLRPLRDIEVAATRISAGAFDERVEVDRAPNEVRRVGTAMNAMLDEVTRGIDERDALVTQLTTSPARRLGSITYCSSKPQPRWAAAPAPRPAAAASFWAPRPPRR